MEDCGILLLQNYIFAGDFKCTLFNDEIWGEKGRTDPLVNAIKEILRTVGLSKIPSLKIS